MPSSGMLRRVALVRTDVSEELSASFIRVTRIDYIGTTSDITSNRRTLRRDAHIIFLHRVRRLLVTAEVPRSPILDNLMMEALLSPKRRLLQEPHGVTSQKTPFFIFGTNFTCCFELNLMILNPQPTQKIISGKM
jgi:hypothetical protein